MPLPFFIVNSLGFLVVKEKLDKKMIDNYIGTAFFVSVPSETDGRYIYLVTAKHNVKGIEKNLYLRLNTFDYKRDDMYCTT